ncbi:hypothetical protein PAXINDRAFT_93546 [Paxillus involutus ATCC 200175]|uniref:Uncharacterized protein n=1 Tax=Paxillus involutus ATCC 200175 TaxID=664439 RepID=A0A0C9T1G9_PAXIN|nr:hypothetical protein PAXINDRAFT_93546 [Paxillus involutus ATCC 200175]
MPTHPSLAVTYITNFCSFYGNERGGRWIIGPKCVGPNTKVGKAEDNRTMEANSEWQTAKGEWQMANGKWQMANGKWQRFAVAIRHSLFNIHPVCHSLFPGEQCTLNSKWQTGDSEWPRQM